jgi:hypothetical protein
VSASEIIEAVLAAGGELAINGDRIHYHIPQHVAPLLDELRRHKATVQNRLRQREHRKAFCHLLPFIGKRVCGVPMGQESYYWLKTLLPLVWKMAPKSAGTTPRR